MLSGLGETLSGCKINDNDRHLRKLEDEKITEISLTDILNF